MSVFLSAEWRKLILFNYVADEQLLLPLVPAGTTLDTFNGKCYISLVGFMFLHTRVKGISIPFHRDFEEVNLRFYVKRTSSKGELKRGVSFIKEIVPKTMITFVARTIYGEPYETLSMKHEWKNAPGELTVEYGAKKDRWHSMKVVSTGEAEEMVPGSEAEFITEHYWGYTRHDAKNTSEYEVWHPRWKCYPVKSFSTDFDFGKIYGEQYAFLAGTAPESVMLAEGSEIKVMSGGKLIM